MVPNVIGNRKLQIANRRERGSTLLLVLAALLLSLILGLTYLEVVRLDRRSTANLANAGQIDDVIESIVVRVEGRLRDDLGMNTANQYFAAPDNENSTVTDQAEHYDYPGDKDLWLAVSAPTVTGTTALFDQVTWLGTDAADVANEYYVTQSGQGNDTNRTLVAEDATVKPVGSPWPYPGYPARPYDPADADGDGITDSKPQRPPTPYNVTHNGVNYFMWVRIIDNSSMLNIDTALSQVDGAGNYDPAANAPRWRYPSELDFGGFAFGWGAMTEVAGFIGRRLTAPGTSSAPAPLPVPWTGAPAARDAFWLTAARLYGGNWPAHTKMGPENELDLRYRNGLSFRDVQSPIEHDAVGMPIFLRRDATERNYKEALFNSPLVNTGTIGEYFDLEPRHQLTVLSGYSAYRPNLVGEAAGRNLKPSLDLTNTDALADEIVNVLGAAWVPPLETGLSTADEYAVQFIANMVDYADTDSRIASVTENGVTRYGLEALPFISEIYIEHAYEVTAGTDTILGVEVPAYKWDRKTPPGAAQQGAGYAIELRNPFRKKIISLTGLKLKVGATSLDLSSIQSFPAALLPGETVIVFRDSGDGVPMKVKTDDTDDKPWAPAPLFAGPVDIPEFDNTPTAIDVVLTARDQADTMDIVYQRVTVQPVNAQNQYTLAASDLLAAGIAAPTPGVTQYKQRATIGNGNGVNVLTYRADEFTTAVNYLETAGLLSEYPALPQDLDALGLEHKAPKGQVDRIVGDSKQMQIVIQDAAIGSIGELAMIPILGLTPVSATIPDAWNARTSMETLFLDLDAAPPAGATGEAALNYAQNLLNHLSALSPVTDGVDNDGDGMIDESDTDGVDNNGDTFIDEPAEIADEMFIPGTLNLNTAPRELLAAALPVGDAAVRDQIVMALLNYRDQPATRVTLYRPNIPGFGSLGEFFTMPVTGGPGEDAASNHQMNGTRVDFSDELENVDDEVKDDVEERTLVGRWLSQVGAVRSDVFTAYILVRGYNPGDTVPISEKRVMIVFDRSKITAAAGPVVEVVKIAY